MARSARQRLYVWNACYAALILCTLLSRGDTRFLDEQKGGYEEASEIAPGVTESTSSGRQAESSPILISSSMSMSPYSWFQQQLTAFAALERAMMQRLSDGFVENDAASADTQEELLRQVGCARMRAALLNKAALQGSELLTGASISALSAKDSDISSSLASDTGVNTHLRGVDRGSNHDVASGAAIVGSSESGEAGTALSKSRVLRDEDYLYYGYYSGPDTDSYGARGDGDVDELEDQEEDFEKAIARIWAGDWDNLYGDEEFEFEYDVYTDEDADNDEDDIDDDDEDDEDDDDGDEDEEQFDLRGLPMWQHGKGQMQGLSIQQEYGAAGRILKLLEDAYALAFGYGEHRNQDQEIETAAKYDSSTAVSIDPSWSATASTAGSEGSSMAGLVSGSEPATTEQHEETTEASSASTAIATAALEDDLYNIQYEFDTETATGGPAGDDLYFGYEYDGYDDYLQVMALADVMLSELDVDTDGDEWADYLEQAYEYFTFYMDDGLYEYESYDSYGTITALDAPSALAALANIAELVIWAHMGNVVLEVRPAFTSAQMSGNGEIIESGTIIIVSSEAYSGDRAEVGYASTMYDPGLEGSLVYAEPQPSLEVVHDISMRLVLPDGSVNWGLVTMLILTAGTLAMLVGFVASWVSLKRSMALSSRGWVYVPPRGKGYGPGCGSGGGKDGKGCCEYSASLLLRPDDVKGAVCWAATTSVPAVVEDASRYVSPKEENESVAKALLK